MDLLKSKARQPKQPNLAYSYDNTILTMNSLPPGAQQSELD